MRMRMQDAVGTIQLCAGQDAGYRPAFHTVEQIFTDEDSEALLLVSASNVFNCLNRQAKLLKFGTVCPALSYILINTYRTIRSCLLMVSVFYLKRAPHKATH